VRLILSGAAAIAACLLTHTPIRANEIAAAPVDELHAALNAHDLESSLALFADDGLVIQPRIGGGPDVFVGRDEIRWWLQRMHAQHVRLMQSEPASVADGHVRWTDSVSLESYWQLGLDSVETSWDAVVEHGRFQSLTIVLTPAGARRLHGALPPAVPWRGDPYSTDSGPTARMDDVALQLGTLGR
jgi:hypothetical protein